MLPVQSTAQGHGGRMQIRAGNKEEDLLPLLPWNVQNGFLEKIPLLLESWLKGDASLRQEMAVLWGGGGWMRTHRREQVAQHPNCSIRRTRAGAETARDTAHGHILLIAVPPAGLGLRTQCSAVVQMWLSWR